MRVPLSWLREYAAIPQDASISDVDACLVQAGLEVEEIHDLRENVAGPLVVGRVASIEELTEFKKPIRHCHVDVGEDEPRSIICGARNFAENDLVVVALPGSVLPGDFAIASRKTYGRLSDGMIASAQELGAGSDHEGIIVLEPGTATVGADARGVIGLDDVIFELAITPDMAHCFSMRGVAREVAHRFGVAFTDPVASIVVPDVTSASPYPIDIQDTSGCDRFSTRVVRGVDPKATSPAWMKERLTHSGMRPISLAVDITNYVMLELGQPMHAWDLATLSGDLVVRRAVEGEELVTLDNTKRKLHVDDLVITDDTGPLSLAGVMGGQTSEISSSTTDVLMEAAHWDPSTIAQTSRRHRLSSEAGKRFERGTDNGVCRAAVQRAVDLLVEYGGGTLDDTVGDVDHRQVAAPIRVSATLPSRIVGVDYSLSQVEAQLRALGADWDRDGDVLIVTPPSWRPDITDQADIVEEVARLDGYDQIPSVMLAAPPGAGLTPRQRRHRAVGRELASAGFVEAVNYPFIDINVFDAFGISSTDQRRRVVTLANPLVESESALRTTLLPGLLKALKTNIERGHRDVGLFETGLVFSPNDAADDSPMPSLPTDRRPTDAELADLDNRRPIQPRHVATIACGQQELAGWWGKGRPVAWSDALDAAMLVAATAGVTLTVRQAQTAPWHPGRCAELLLDDVVVGHAGELHPNVCDEWDVPRRTCAMELNLDAFPPAAIVPAPVISHYPTALIDVAVVVADDVHAGDVERALIDGAGELLERIRLFDVFTGGKLGEGRKSLAFNLTLRAEDRTLTADEAVAVRTAAVAEAANRCGAELRNV